MKSTGIVRKVDSLGRIVLPIELRRVMGIKTKDPVEIFVDSDKIVLRAYQPGCEFCDGTNNLVTYKEKTVCNDCLNELNELANIKKRGE